MRIVRPSERMSVCALCMSRVYECMGTALYSPLLSLSYIPGVWISPSTEAPINVSFTHMCSGRTPYEMMRIVYEMMRIVYECSA
jgi:hypothetical protein